MAQKSTETKRMGAKKLQKAKDALIALSQLSDYDPQRQEYSAANLAVVSKALQTTNEAELAAKHAWDKARDAAIKAEWNAYNFSISASEQVAAQFGSSSDEYASLGYKKKTEYKKTPPGKKAKKSA